MQTLRVCRLYRSFLSPPLYPCMMVEAAMASSCSSPRATLQCSPSPLPLPHHQQCANLHNLRMCQSAALSSSSSSSSPPRHTQTLQQSGVAANIQFPSARSLKAVLFDIDGTLCDSDPLHYLSFREMLQEVGYQGGIPITEEFFVKELSGGENLYLGLKLFPEWDQNKRDQFFIDKEARFRSLAAKKIKPVEGLNKLCRWIEKKEIKRAAVTNAPRPNAELLISLLGLTNFFQTVIVGGECERSKPFPDPYQKALKFFGLSPDQAFVLEDSSTGLRAAVAAGVAAVGVATRNPKDSLLQAGATFVIDDYNDSELWNALES